MMKSLENWVHEFKASNKMLHCCQQAKHKYDIYLIDQQLARKLRKRELVMMKQSVSVPEGF